MQYGRHVQPLIFHFLFSKHLLAFSGNSLMRHSKKILISILCSSCIRVANYESLNLVSRAQLLPGKLFWLTVANLLMWVLWGELVLSIVFIVAEIHFYKEMLFYKLWRLLFRNSVMPKDVSCTLPSNFKLHLLADFSPVWKRFSILYLVLCKFCESKTC